MKLKGLAALALAAGLTVSAAFASPVLGEIVTDTSQKPMKNAEMVIMQERHKTMEMQDPIDFFENKKAQIQKMQEEGKLTQEQANAKIARIDEKIKAIEEFNTLTAEQKKEKLINHYETVLDKKVQGGKLTKKKAAELLAEFTEKINQWDGKGYPNLKEMGFGRKKR